MDKRAWREEFNRQETEFFFRTIDIKPILLERDYVLKKKSSTRRQPAFARYDRNITVAIGKKTGFWVWWDLNQKTGGVLLKFLTMEYGCDNKGAFDLMRQIAELSYGVEYSMFKDQFAKLELSNLSSGNWKVPIVPQPRAAARQEFNFEEFKEDLTGETITEFTFDKAESFDFFLARGIRQETIDSFSFLGRFGNATGPFGHYPGKNDKTREGAVSPFVFKQHMIIPYQDYMGRMVAIEAKNRYTEAGLIEKKIKERDAGNDPSDIRPNPSLFYPHSSKRLGAWVSNIPENPKAILLSEQPVNALSYYQMHQDDPLVHQTIFICTGGSVTDGHYAILYQLIEKYNIENVVLAFDKDLAGLTYSLDVIKKLPFNLSHEQKCLVHFHPTEKQEMEIDVSVRQGFSKQTPETLMLSVERLRHELSANYSFEGGFNVYPALTLREGYVTVSIPYTDKNISEIIRLGQYLLKTRPDVFHQKFPPHAKDWNDEERGIHRAPVSPTYLLLDQPQDRNKLFVSKKNSLIYHQRFTSFDHNIQEDVGDVNPFALKHFIKPAKTIIGYPFLMQALEAAQSEYEKSIPLLKGDFIKQTLRQGIVYVPLSREFMLGDQLLAKWNESYLTIGERWPDKTQQRVLSWMMDQLLAGNDPNQPEVSIDYQTVLLRGAEIGMISKWFTFQETEKFDSGKLNSAGVAQMELLLDGLSEVRSKWEMFREKYPEPVSYYSSNNLVLEENRIPIYKFDKGRLHLLAEPEVMLSRNFNPFFFKALQLFVENQGVFYNYMRLMKVDYESGAVFYNTRDHQIGQLLEDEGKKHMALYPNIPDSMKREMQLFTPFPIATEALIKKLGATITPPGLNAVIKEKKISRIPYEYQLFYNKEKFSQWSPERLKKASKAQQQLHTQAFLWHINNVGSVGNVLGTDKENFYELNGVVYFNRIAVAKYNANQDVLDMLAPPSSKFFQYLAIFERNLVKDPAHRVYSDHLLISNDEKQSTQKVNLDQVGKILDKIEFIEETRRLQIVDRSFKIRDIGYMDGQKMVIDEIYQRYSEVFRDALAYYAGEKDLLLEWKNLEFEKEPVVATISSIHIQKSEKKYEHELLSTPSGLLQSVVNAPFFQKDTFLSNEEINYAFLPGKEGRVTMSYGSTWDKVETTQLWRSMLVENATTLVLAQNPDQAMLSYHYNLPFMMHGGEIFLSMLNADKKEIKAVVESIIIPRNIRQLHIVGDDAFNETYLKAFSHLDQVGKFCFELFTVEQAVSHLKEDMKTYEPDPGLQDVIANISGHNFLNPAKGLVYFPMESEGTKSKSVLGAQLLLSSDMDALWYSRPLKSAQRVVLTSTPEEALYYMALNKDFIQNDVFVSFQARVTDQQIKALTDQLKVRRFHGKVIVANTEHLSEQLLDHNFKMPIQLENPLIATSFREAFHISATDYQMVKREIRLSRKHISEDRVKQLGKSEAPALVTSMPMQGPKAQHAL